MFKKISFISLIVLFVFSLWGVKDTEAGGLPSETPRLVALRYLQELAKVYDPEEFTGGIANLRSPSDLDKYLLISTMPTLARQYNVIAGSVSSHFRAQGRWTTEEVIAAVEAAVSATDFAIDFDEVFGSEFNSAIDESRDQIDEILGGNLSVVSKGKVITAEAEVSFTQDRDIKSFTVRNTSSRVVEKEQTIEDWLRDWYINGRKTGASYVELINAIALVGNITGNTLDKYFEDGSDQDSFDLGTWSNLATALYWTQIANILEGVTGEWYIRDGITFIKDQAEAIAGVTIGRNDRLVDVSDMSAIEVAEKMLQTRAELISPLSYFLETNIDVNNPTHVGILSSWAEGVAGRLRRFNFIPATETWQENVSFEEALNSVSQMIRFSRELADPVGSFFGLDTSPRQRRSDTSTAEHMRNMLTQWAFNVQDIADFIHEDREALNLITDILTPGSGRGEQLLSKFQSFWEASGGSFRLTNRDVQGAYAGLVGMVSSVLTRPNYFNIAPRDLDAAFGKTLVIFASAVNKKDFQGNTLMDLVAQYLHNNDNARASDLSFTGVTGYQTGVASFWAQVCEAKGFDYVRPQLDARRELITYLANKTTGSFIPERRIADHDILSLFERVLDGDLGNLDNTLQRAKSIIDRAEFSTDPGTGQNIIENRLEIAELIDRAVKEINTPLFPEQQIDFAIGSTNLTVASDDDIIIVPEQPPVFGTTGSIGNIW